MQKEYLGFNSINKLENILLKYKPKAIFLVRGNKSYVQSGASSIIDSLLKGYNVIHFYGFKTNPKIEDIENGLELFKDKNCDFVIAVGGGTTIDVAKAINISSNNNGNLVEYLKQKKNIENKGSPLIAIPTTSGSGSEATKFAVVYINKVKYSLEHDYILPDYAIIDPQFTINLPKSITAYTGMDALSQAIESYWSINSTDESKIYSKEAIKLIIKNLEEAVNRPSKKSRYAMAKAAHLAGKAINISKTTACHAISYPIASYFNIPHGHAVALTLAPMLLYNSQVIGEDISDKRGIDYVKNTINDIVNFIGSDNIEDARKKIISLINNIGLSVKLSELGIKTNLDIDLIIKNINIDRIGNNPRRLNEDSLRNILNRLGGNHESYNNSSRTFKKIKAIDR